MTRSRVKIFRNERTWSTPLDTKLTFWCVLYYLGAFGTIWLPYETRWKTGRTSAKVCATKSVGIFRSERNRSNPFDPKLMFWCVSYHLGAFGTIWLPYETLWKSGGSFLQKFVPRSRVRIFCNEQIRSTPLDPKLTLWCISYHLGAFGTVCLPYEIRCKTGWTSTKVRATKSLRNFSQRTHPTHPIGP